MSDLLDAYGRPVVLELLDGPPQAAPTYHGVRNIYSVQHPSVGLTPEKLSTILRQAEWGDPLRYLELCEDMEEKDLHYRSVLSTRKDTVAQLELVVSPAGKDAQAMADADFVREVISPGGTLDLQSSLADVGDAIGKGFSVLEIEWETNGAHWLPRQLRWRDPRWFMFDWVGGQQVLVRTWRNQQLINDEAWSERGWDVQMAGLIERAPDGQTIGIQPATAPLIPYKFVTHIAKSKSGLPIRGGLSRAVAWIYLFKNYVLKDMVTFAERYGMPARIGKYGTGATDQDKNTLLRACAQLGSDAATIIPESMTLELLEAAGSGSGRGAVVFDNALRYFDDAMSKAVLGQTLTTDQPTSGGSRAMAQVHENVRRDILEWDAKRLGATLTRDLIRPIVDLNLGPRARYPQVSVKIMTGADKSWSDMVVALVDHGLKVGQDAVREQVGLPAPEETEDLLTPASKAPAPGAPGMPGGLSPSPATAPTPAIAPAAPESGGEARAAASMLSEPPEELESDMRRARVVVVLDGRVCAISPADELYVTLPGGHAEVGEPMRAAAERETLEEAGLAVDIGRWVADFTDDTGHRRYYVGHYRGATPSEHLPTMTSDGDGSGVNAVLWLGPADLGRLTSEYDRAAAVKVLQARSVSVAASSDRRRVRRPAAQTEVYATRMAARWHETIGPWIEDARRLATTCASLPEFRDRLHELVDEFDSRAFEESMTRAGFNVRTAANTKTKLP